MIRRGGVAGAAGQVAPLELTGLSRVFPTPSGPFIAVKDVNALVEAGEFVAILGHSGCGKSTVLAILAGLDQATLGGVVIDGKEVTGPGPERAIVFQAPCLLPWLTARQNVQIAATQGVSTRTRREAAMAADHYLELVGLTEVADQLPAQLSLGTQQCVSLARALAVEPRFLLLDEPFSQLDSLTRFDLQDLLLRVWEPASAEGPAGRESAKTIVMVTHDIDEALYLADRLILMTDGPEATVGEVLRVPFARPRTRSSVLAHPQYQDCRRRVINFLEHHAHQSRPSALDDVLHHKIRAN
jgi:nitrate ABC transporter ATP-binding subunit